MKIKYQLFVVLLIASALLIALMLAVNSASFNRQFISYINSVETRRLQPLVDDLAQLYAEHGGWQTTTPDSWNALIRQHSLERRSGQLRGSGPPPPPRPEKRSREKKRDKPPPGSRPPPRRSGQWLSLTDNNRSLLHGRPPAQSRMEWLPVETTTGIAGFLGFVRHRQFNRAIDQEFARQQKRNFLYAALAMTVLSGLLAIPLASRIIKPLAEVNRAVGALGSGDYRFRSHSTRRDEFGDLARNINRLGDSLEQNKAARQRWIADISHELRTPVAILQSELEALQDGIRKPDEHTIHSLHAEVLRLGRLIDDLHQLSLSDIGALDYQMTPIELHQLLADFLAGHKNQTAAASVSVSFQSNPALIDGDAERLNQLLNNLLQNTLRYTNEPAQLNVSITTKGDTATVVWEDSAPGVSQHDLLHLFEPLYRADQSRNRKTSGSGLGLAIVQKIVAAHNGHIEASQSTLGGLKIVIELPSIA